MLLKSTLIQTKVVVVVFYVEKMNVRAQIF